jgi:histone-lysine N-methyltransferase MLL3
MLFCTTCYDARAFWCFIVALILADSSLEHDPISKLELDEAKEDAKLEPVEVYKEGMVVPPREDGRPPEPPEGFTIHTTESGVMVLRRKRQRNLQKLGKMRWT